MEHQQFRDLQGVGDLATRPELRVGMKRLGEWNVVKKWERLDWIKTLLLTR
jgi:hypothetical protein